MLQAFVGTACRSYFYPGGDMRYEPMSLEKFRARILAGRYASAQAARQAIASTRWTEEQRAEALAIVTVHLDHGEPVGSPLEPASDLEKVRTTVEQLIVAARLNQTLRTMLVAAVEGVRVEFERFSTSAAPVAPKMVAKQVKARPAVAEAPPDRPKQDLSKLMDGEVDDPGEDDDEDEVARMLTPRPDLEEGIAELEAKATTEKDRVTAREIGRIMREQVANGAFGKKS